jgi:hypothetical protein
MNKAYLSLGAATLLAILLAGCESDGGIAARGQEKSAVYASLKPWQKKYIDKGTIAVGFSPDMVYIAMGKPDTVEAKDYEEGKVELWTYKRYYPVDPAMHGFQYSRYTTDSAYSPTPASTQGVTSAGNNPNALGAPSVPRGLDRGNSESIGKTGGPQGGSMVPADIPSYTVQVLFAEGKVLKMGATPNVN